MTNKMIPISSYFADIDNLSNGALAACGQIPRRIYLRSRMEDDVEKSNNIKIHSIPKEITGTPNDLKYKEQDRIHREIKKTVPLNPKNGLDLLIALFKQRHPDFKFFPAILIDETIETHHTLLFVNRKTASGPGSKYVRSLVLEEVDGVSSRELSEAFLHSLTKGMTNEYCGFEDATYTYTRSTCVLPNKY